MKAFFTLLRAGWKYAAGLRWRIVFYISLFILANAVWLFEPYVIGKILNAVQQSEHDPSAVHSILLSLGLLAGLSLGFWMFHGPARVLERTTAFRVRLAFKHHLFSVITALPMQWHRDHHSGRSINRMSKATGALFDFMENGYQLVEMFVRPMGALIALLILFPSAAVVAIVAMSGACGLVFLFDRVLLPLYDRINEKDHFVASALHDYITNITTVITLRLEQLTRTELYRRMTEYFPIYRRESRINEVKWFIATMVISLTTAGVLGGYAVATLRLGAVPLVGTFFMLYEYLQRIGGAFYTFAWKYSQIVEQYANLKAVDPILRAERAEYRTSSGLPKNWRMLQIKNLRFSYTEEASPEEQQASPNAPLRRLQLSVGSIVLGRRSKIAFVGESGSGKSTMLALIRGLMTTNHVRVFCDDVLLKKGLRRIAPHVTLIPQDPEIFANTIEYNITVDTKVKREELMKDVALARFSAVLKRLPKGLKTDISEKGVNLSGGEKQRLALARGIFAAKTSDLILLDEPTSSVDTGNERAIYEGLFRRFADRCIISSIHKLHLLPMFQYVYVFRDGKVVAEGAPVDLLKEGGMLHPLWVREREGQAERVTGGAVV